MVPAKGRAVSRQLEVLWTSGTFTGLSDAQLLGRFTGGGEETAESAFRELLERHGPMVLGVCRQILRRPQDADDAFQATFLVLVRKARTIRVGDSLAPWLYGVAYRTAHRARTRASRYHGADVDLMAEAADPTTSDVIDLDVRPLLHEELARLPDKYRAPIVLCHLEGKSHEEAAGLLSWPIGTVSGRLSRGRQLLKARLERRGVSVSPTFLAGRWLIGNQAVLSSSLVETTLGTAARFAASATISTSVLSLTHGVLRTMFLTKIKAILLVLVTVGAASGGAAWAIRTPAAGNPPAPAESRTVTSPRSDQQTIERSSGPLPGLRPEEAAPGRVPSAVPSGGMGLPPRPGAQNPQARGAPRGRTPFIRSDSIIIAESPDRLSLQAISLDENKDWQRLTLPPGVTAIPMLSDDTVAPAFEGQSIRQVAAFSKSIGEWRTQQLMKPAEGQLSPIIGSGGAVYQVGNDVYAFSAFMGSWGVLHLEGADRPQITLSSKDIMVTHGNRLYVFGLRQGRFSSGIEVNREPARREPRATKPVR